MAPPPPSYLPSYVILIQVLLPYYKQTFIKIYTHENSRALIVSYQIKVHVRVLCVPNIDM